MITYDERGDLLDSAQALHALANVMEEMANGAAIAAEPGEFVTTLADLVPAGNLDDLAQNIRDNTPISDQDLNTLLAAANQDIRVHSRFAGLVENVTAIVRFFNKTVLPIVSGL